MKKLLLSFAAGASLCSSAYTQNMDSVWQAHPEFISALSVNESAELYAHSGFSCLISEAINWENNNPENYKAVEVADEELIVTMVRAESENDFYGDFTVDWGIFIPGENAGNKFGYGADTLFGYVWDATQSDVVIEAEFKLSVADPTESGISTAQIRADIVDANGRVSNQSIGAGSVSSGDLDATGDWTPIEWVFASQVYDQQTSSWWEVDPKAVPVGDSVVNLRTEMSYVPLDMTRITKLAFIIDHGATTADKQPVGKEVIFNFRNIKVGDGSVNPCWCCCCDYFPSDKITRAKRINIYPVPATDVLNVPGKAAITNVFGEAVAIGVDEIDVSSLSPGIYIVTVAEGSATIIIE